MNKVHQKPEQNAPKARQKLFKKAKNAQLKQHSCYFTLRFMWDLSGQLNLAILTGNTILKYHLYLEF